MSEVERSVVERTDTETPVSLEAGSARSPGPSTRELILGDSTSVPAPLLEQSYEFQGDTDVPYAEFTSQAYADAEHEHMWSRTWQWACREEHVPDAGDYYVYDVGDRSALIVRGSDDSVKAFHNACLHRGTQLKPAGTSGFSRSLRCPFHGWTWGLDGSLQDVPCAWDFPHVGPESHRLPELAVARWGGFIFVNFADDPEPFDDYVGVLPAHFADWNLADRYVEVHACKRLPANWKASAEAFLEAYHIAETHSQALGTAGDANAQYDIFGEHVSRFVHTIGTPSPHVPEADRLDEPAMLAALLASKHPDAVIPEIPSGERARDVFARLVQKALGEQYDNDFSDLSVTETIDSIEYFVFPNAFFFPGLAIPLCYRFRPDGPDHCLFDVLYLRPNPRTGRPPEPAEPIYLGVDDSYATVAGFPASMAHVLDQDTANLAAQTRGFKTSKKPGQTLGNYQESRARHFQAAVRRYISEGQMTTQHGDAT